MKRVLIWWIVLIIWWFSIWSIFAATLWPNYTTVESSVNNWEIRWGGSTKYSIQWNYAIQTWNNLWVVDILPDTIWTFQDLKVQDINSSSPSNYFYGYWDYDFTSGEDRIFLNKYYLDGNSSHGTFSDLEKQHTVSHELGHALGLAHSYWTNIMKQWKLSNTVVWTQDKSSYRTKWGY